MDFGSKFVYLGNEEEDFEEVKVSEVDNVALSDSDCSDDDGETCILDILDTAGQEEYSSLRDQYVRTGNGFAIIYSITDKKSFEEAEAIFSWIKRLRNDVHVVLVANKQDLHGSQEVQVTEKEGEDLATRLGVPFYKTSAKTGDGVKAAISGLVRIIPRKSNDYKIVMLGAGAVGKSSITLQFVSGNFVNDYDPTIEDSFRKMVSISGLQAISKEQKKANKKADRRKRKAAASSSSLANQQNRQGARPKSGLFSSLRNVFLPKSREPASPPDQLYHGQFPDSNDDDRIHVQRVKHKKVDGNVVLIPLGNLAEDPNLVTGDPIKCTKCQAVLTSTAHLESEGATKLWTCEFCGEANKNLDISEDEVPQGDSFDYMLSPPTQLKEEEKEEGKAVQTKTTPGIMVYCIDISSSMSCQARVPDSHAAWREERTRGEESINYVTRLRCMQLAIERLAEQLKLDQPEKQVLLTVFSSNVKVEGGGRRNNMPQFNHLENRTFDHLLEMGLNLYTAYPLSPIEESHQAIDEALKALYPTGCTALGPALSICTGFVSKVPSSEIILCTDGEPNTGVGSLNGANGAGFYEMIGNYARSKNISINIISMEGAATGLQHVSKAAENSGGTTTKLNPAEIMRQLRLIAQNEVVATSVTVRFYLHPQFTFDEPDFPDDLSQLEKEVGSVKKETDLTFKFKLRDSSEAKDIKSVPFQVQIEYTRPDGMQCLRILSRSTEATTNRKAMEENINVSVVGVTAMKTTAKLAKAGQANQAQHMVKGFKRMVDRGAVSSKQKEERLAFQSEVLKLDDHLTFGKARLQACAMEDLDCDVYSKALSTNAVQQCSAAAPSKLKAVSRRKMATESSKAAYYSYHDCL